MIHRWGYVLALGMILASGLVLDNWLPQALGQDQDAQSQRLLAPGVLRTIPPEPQVAETYEGPMSLVEVVTQKTLDWTPNYTPKTRTLFVNAQQAVLRREIWNLEFSFKPLRHISVDVPQPSGKMQRKLLWYLVYRVRYVGNNIGPKAEIDQWQHETFSPVQTVNPGGRYFFPQFILVGHELNKTYLDRIIPAALEPITDREKPDGRLHNSITISKEPIPLSQDQLDTGVWGVAIWEDVDPRIDFITIYVKGLTNAYKPVDVPDAFQLGDPPGKGRQFLSKTLQLHFWRPGDTIREQDDDIRFGMPVDEDPSVQSEILTKYGSNERLDYDWVYR